MTSRRNWVIVATGSLLLAACGSSGGSADSDNTTADDTEESSAASAETSTESAESTETTEPVVTTTPVTTAPAGISSFDQVQPAVIQIIATGTIRDPEVGFATQAGSGSGFIIDPSGLAVTNNHVVTGAATLEVFIGGETEESYNAQVIGVSECNDLALIQIDSDEDLPVLEWQEGDPTVGQEVYAAGFPLGDPEFTLTRGIVAKAKASGDTPWASIDSTIEQDANIQPGNSGGPLVAADGSVVAVNYAGGSPTNTEQFFAISSELAQDVVEELKKGDFESLGINGQVVADEEAGIFGVWVSGVAPGSPVDDAGVLPGDIVTALNGLPIGTDGTMKDYCDVLRTSAEGKPIEIEVLRYDTSELLRGDLYGEQPIAAVFSFAEEVGDVDTDRPAAAGYSGYETIVDDTGVITVDVPVEWADRYTAPLALDDGSQLPFIEASTDIAALDSSYSVPGLIYAVIPGSDGDIDGTIGTFAPAAGECTTDNGISDYDDGLFSGRYGYWSGCGGSTEIVVLVAVPEDASYTAVLAVQILSDADWAALDQAFATFNVTS